ncbi:hypothetical protein BKA70DRAFT_1128740, partial [Coprinopsis sp. MPI-PUGE-AT-0042]
SVAAYLHSQLECSPKLYLLKGRMEPSRSDEGVWSVVPLLCRHYLHVANPDHRRALTRILASNHYYASELLQYCGVPWAERLCRLCGESVETPEHALLQCTGNQELMDLRSRLVISLLDECSDDDARKLHKAEGDCITQLRVLIGIRETITLVARYCFHVQELIRMYPTYNANSRPELLYVLRTAILDVSWNYALNTELPD